MSARSRSERWAAIVRETAERRGARYESVGGINAKGDPPALCPGGRNRLTGHLSDELWGASCDAEEREEGWLRKARLPGAVLIKAHMPDLADVMGPFDVESIERDPGDRMRHRFRRTVNFESISFNRRYTVTVPAEHDPIALRELMSPGFLDWAAGIDHRVEFGVSERQLYFLWGLEETSAPELEAALDAGGELFRRVRREMEQEGIATYPAGPWHAGLEHFPDDPPGVAQARS